MTVYRAAMSMAMDSVPANISVVPLWFGVAFTMGSHLSKADSSRSCWHSFCEVNQLDSAWSECFVDWHSCITLTMPAWFCETALLHVVMHVMA